MIHALYWVENTFNPVLEPIVNVLGALLFGMICAIAVKRVPEPATETDEVSRGENTPSCDCVRPASDATDELTSLARRGR